VGIDSVYNNMSKELGFIVVFMIILEDRNWGVNTLCNITLTIMHVGTSDIV